MKKLIEAITQIINAPRQRAEYADYLRREHGMPSRENYLLGAGASKPILISSNSRL